MKYKLRELSRKDLKVINTWRNDEKLISYLGANYRYIDLEIDEAWFDNYLKNRNNTVRCAIVDSDDMIVGLVSLTNINYVNRTAEFHIMIGESDNQNQGIGTYAVDTMLKHAFNNLNLNRIYLEVLKTNDRAIRVYEKNGFQREGVLRQAFYKNGKYEDAIIMSVLKEEK